MNNKVLNYKDNQEEKVRFISLMSDIAFKTLWINGSPSTKKYLHRIITSISGIDTEKFHLSTNELGIKNYKSIANKVDILLVSKDEKIKINIELNRKYSIYLTRKNDTYIYKLAGETYSMTDKKDKYKYDINVQQINLNNFYNRENKNIPMNYYVNADPINNLIKSGIKIHNLYLPKIKDMCYDGCDNLYTDLAMFTVSDYEEMFDIVKGNKEREAVMEDLERLGSDTEFVDLYDHEEFEKIMFEAEKDEAYEQGIAKGIEQGLEQGIEQGVEQGQSTLIKNMFNNGLSKEEISNITNISIESIEKYNTQK